MKKPICVLRPLRWQDHIVGDPIDTAMHLKYLHQRYTSYCKYVRLISVIGGTTIFALAVISTFLMVSYQ